MTAVTRRRLGAAALLGIGGLSGAAALERNAAAAEVPAAFVRDVRPTTIERGDTLVLECPGLRVGTPVMVFLSGSAEQPSSGTRTLTFSWEGPCRPAAGDRVLCDLPEQPPGRVRLDTLRVSQPDLDGTARTWTRRPGHEVTLELFPASLRRLSTTAMEVLPTGAGPLGAIGRALPPATLPFLPVALVILVALVIHALVAPVTGLLVVWERKISGRMQSRLGPNRVGPWGWLQWLADGLKMITKEDLIPTDADGRLFRMAPYLMWMSVFATFVVLPLSQTAIVADMNVGLMFLFAITALTVIGVLLGGWSSNSKWSLLGGLRSAAQMVSYELPVGLALLQVALLAGSLSPQAIVRAQGGLPHEWFVFANPFAFVSFFIYFISALAEGNRTPFDLPEAESELVAGYATEYSGFRFLAFSLAEWTNVYVMSAIVAALFLGGWNVPFVAPATVAASPLLGVLSIAVMLTKVVVLVFVIIWLRWTLPRLRVDQLMALCWKVLVPFSLAAFLGTAAWMALVPRTPVFQTIDLIVRVGTFLVGGVGVFALLVARILANFRATRLLYVGDAQFTWPFVEPPARRYAAPSGIGGTGATPPTQGPESPDRTGG